MKLWSYFKKYWKIIGCILFAVFGLILLRRNDNSLMQKFKDIDAIHKNELKKIEEARQKEREEWKESERKYQQTISIIRERYESDKKDLDKKKEKEIKQIVDNHGKDPQELALQLSKATGFQVILPEEE